MASEGYFNEEAAQLSPLEGPFELIVLIGLFVVFLSAMAYSYQKYDEQIGSREKFYAALEFSNLLRNNLLCEKNSGVLYPGLITQKTLLERGNFGYLNKFWEKSYEWEVVVRDPNGVLKYEFGSLNKDATDPRKPRVRAESFFASSHGSVQVTFAAVAMKIKGSEVVPARMEVWVW